MATIITIVLLATIGTIIAGIAIGIGIGIGAGVGVNIYNSIRKKEKQQTHLQQTKNPFQQ